MVVKVYISGISGNKEVKKRQQRVILILESKNVKYELLDIAEPNMEEAKEYMQTNSKQMGCTISDPNPRHPLPPQLFNDDEYCGDYDAFDMANEIDEMEKFLKLAPDEIAPSLAENADVKIGNGEVPSEEKSKEASPEKESTEAKSEGLENGKDEEATVPESDTVEVEDKPKEKSPTPQKEKSPTPQKEKSPTPQKEKSPTPTKEEDAGDGENATDDQKAENAENGSKEDAEVAEEEEETEKSEGA